MDDAAKRWGAAEHPSAARPRWLRRFYACVGWLCVGIGIAGLFLPFMPGTVFLIAAAACFARSSPRFEAWLIGHPRLGPAVQAWRAERAIPRGAKWLACASLVVSFAVLLLAAAPLLVVLGTGVLLALVAGWIVSRPEPRKP